MILTSENISTLYGALERNDFNFDTEFAIAQMQRQVESSKFHNYYTHQLMWGNRSSIWVKNPTRTIRIQTGAAGMTIMNEAIQKEFGSSK